MKKIKIQIAIWFWLYVIWLIERGYGADCETSDIEDFPEMYSNPLETEVRCASCVAKETVGWIKNHINLLKFYA